MRNKVLSLLIVSTFLLSGCSGTTAKDAEAGSNAKNSAAAAKNSQDSTAATEQRVEVKTDFNAAKPGTVPQLSAEQKTQVNSKLNTSLSNVDSALKSLQEAADIDLSSVN